MPETTASPGTTDEVARVGSTGSSWVASGGNDLGASDDVSYESGPIFADGDYTEFAWACNFGFSLPSGAVINGVTVSYERKHSGGTAVINDEVSLIGDAGTIIGSLKSPSTNYSASDTIVTVGGPTDVWGASLTEAIVEHANFGVGISVKVVTAGTANKGLIDHVSVTVRYNEAGGGGSSPGTGPVAGTVIGNGDIMYSEVYIDEAHTFTAALSAGTGAATDATGSVSYRVYEDETTTPILTGTMAVLDDSNTTGFYSEQITLSAANGFEVGKRYTVWVSATVSAVAQAGIVDRFIVRRNYWTEVPTEITERADTPWEMLHQVWKRFFNKMTMNRDTGVTILYNNDGTTSEVEGTNSTSGATETRGQMS